MFEYGSQRKKVSHFFSEHASTVIFLGIIFLVLIFSVSTLVTKPRLWTDEAVSIDIAKSFITYGSLSPEIAPGIVYPFPHLIQSTGYPLTVSLAAVFKIFGYGLYQARIFMLVWMLGALFALFYFGRKIFDDRTTCSALLLIASFASFYGSGRTVVGEIPGFVFLLVGLYFFAVRERFLWSGFFLGLAIVTKPSVFGLLIPVLFLALFFERGRFLEFFRKLLVIVSGMALPALGWLFFAVEKPFTLSTWESVVNFYKNPYSSSIQENVVSNILGISHSTTLIYFGGLFLLVGFARFLAPNARLKFLYNFVLIYGVFAFLYYLRSPGWLRYILIAELLILFVLPNSIETVLRWLRGRFAGFSFEPKNLAVLFIVALVSVQTVQMFTVSDIFYSDAGLQTAGYVNEHFPDKSVSLFNALDVSVLVETSRRYNTFELTGLPLFGDNALLGNDLPDIVVAHPGDRFLKEGQDVLDSSYRSDATVGGYAIYAKK